MSWADSYASWRDYENDWLREQEARRAGADRQPGIPGEAGPGPMRSFLTWLGRLFR
jgi:hypothetical protein